MPVFLLGSPEAEASSAARASSAWRRAWKVIDGDQRAQLAAQGAQRLGISALDAGHRRQQLRVILAAIEQRDNCSLLDFIASAQAVLIGRALDCAHLFRHLRQCRRSMRQLGQQKYSVAQGGAAQSPQRAPDTHAAGGLAGRQADEEGQEVHGRAG